MAIDKRDNNKIVAVKQINKRKFNTNELEQLQQEINIGFLLSEENHPGFVKTIEVFHDS